MRKEPPQPVSFRLAPYYLKRLVEGGKPYGMSAGEYARRIVIEALEDTERLRLRDEVSALRAELERVRSDLATAVEALLVASSNPEIRVDREEAREWVTANLRRR